jgi:hypothetical protein
MRVNNAVPIIEQLYAMIHKKMWRVLRGSSSSGMGGR